MNAKTMFAAGHHQLAVTALLALLTAPASAGLPAAPLPTLDGRAPLVIGHRGLPGLYPEQTRPSYEGAADAGADALEMDLHLSKDCVLVARHNPWLSDNTNIATVALTNADVAARRRTVPGTPLPVKYAVALHGGPDHYLSDLGDPNDPTSVLKSLVVDGADHTGDWAIADFTVSELKQWIGGTTYDARDDRPTGLNGKYPILTMQEIVDIARQKSAVTGRTISLYPEAKNPYWNNAQAIANGCGSGKHPFEDAIVKLIKDNGLNTRSAPVHVQSFDPASLLYMRSIGLQTKLVQLIGGSGVNYNTGAVTYQGAASGYFSDARPYSWTVAGDGRNFGALLTPAGLAAIKLYADGIGVWKPAVIALAVERAGQTVDSLANATVATPTGLVQAAHQSGLFVHVYTFRNEKQYLAGAYHGDPAKELRLFFEAGVDGVFTDFTPTAIAARAAYLKALEQ
ncbi:glycerophosphodiester phosphodiesterase family protein [Massilia sp. DWR3-1-1]|uniref:glycerophosphodiester phosphodiesterase family protein n=1 Tax=Massilia sp. DWR3-1-1 TaxID=2804559 RepID=UPI003CED6895